MVPLARPLSQLVTQPMRPVGFGPELQAYRKSASAVAGYGHGLAAPPRQPRLAGGPPARLGHVIGEELADHRPTTAPAGGLVVLASGGVQRAEHQAATVPEPLPLQGRQTVDEFNRSFSGRSASG